MVGRRDKPFLLRDVFFFFFFFSGVKNGSQGLMESNFRKMEWVLSVKFYLHLVIMILHERCIFFVKVEDLKISKNS